MTNLRCAAFALWLAVVAGCAGDRAPDDDRPAAGGGGTPGAAGTSGRAAGDAAANREAGFADRNFVVEMMASNQAEVELGKLAQQKASNRRIKEFAATLVRDHQNAAADLKTVAQQANIETTNVNDKMDDHKDVRERLARLSGTEFDREFIQAMVDKHEKAVNDVEDKADAPDNDHIKQWAAKTLPTLKKHLEEARQIHESMDKRAGT